MVNIKAAHDVLVAHPLRDSDGTVSGWYKFDDIYLSPEIIYRSEPESSCIRIGGRYIEIDRAVSIKMNLYDYNEDRQFWCDKKQHSQRVNLHEFHTDFGDVEVAFSFSSPQTHIWFAGYSIHTDCFENLTFSSYNAVVRVSPEHILPQAVTYDPSRLGYGRRDKDSKSHQKLNSTMPNHGIISLKPYMTQVGGEGTSGTLIAPKYSNRPQPKFAEGNDKAFPTGPTVKLNPLAASIQPKFAPKTEDSRFTASSTTNGMPNSGHTNGAPVSNSDLKFTETLNVGACPPSGCCSENDAPPGDANNRESVIAKFDMQGFTPLQGEGLPRDGAHRQIIPTADSADFWHKSLFQWVVENGVPFPVYAAAVPKRIDTHLGPITEYVQTAEHLNDCDREFIKKEAFDAGVPVTQVSHPVSFPPTYPQPRPFEHSALIWSYAFNEMLARQMREFEWTRMSKAAARAERRREYRDDKQLIRALEDKRERIFANHLMNPVTVHESAFPVYEATCDKYEDYRETRRMVRKFEKRLSRDGVMMPPLPTPCDLKAIERIIRKRRREDEMGVCYPDERIELRFNCPPIRDGAYIAPTHYSRRRSHHRRRSGSAPQDSKKHREGSRRRHESSDYLSGDETYYCSSDRENDEYNRWMDWHRNEFDYQRRRRREDNGEPHSTPQYMPTHYDKQAAERAYNNLTQVLATNNRP